MTVIVPDASVLLKWVLPGTEEPDAAKAIELRDAVIAGDIDMLLPSLWLYEVGNILALKRPEVAEQSLGSLVDFGLKEAEHTPEWRQQILRLTRQYRVTFYDAAYHALAITQLGTLVTADQKYVNKTKRAGHLVLLANYA